jgi:hypothetical protein
MKIKLRIKFIVGVFLLGSITTVAQATTVNIGTLTVSTPGSIGSFASTSTLGLGDIITNSAAISTTFYDDFVFTIASGATISSILASLQTTSFAGITGFSESLYSGTIPGTSYSANGTNPLAATSLIASTTSNNLSASNLNAGTYTLQFSGTLAAKTGLLPTIGTYASLVSISPVPEEDTYAMMLAGLSLIGFIARRKNQLPA